MQKFGHLSLYFLDPSKRDKSGEGAEREELGVVLLPKIDSTEVVFVGAEVACVTVRSCATI